jgi:polar amino acid transport system substrate-binding protein
MTTDRAPLRTRGLAFLAVALLMPTAFAQPPGLPTDAYEGLRRVQGDRVTFCVDASPYTQPLERAILQAIADALLLEARFVDVQATYSITAEALLEDLYVLLADHCDAYAGISYTDGGYADWMTMTRPYVRYRSVLVTNQPDVDALRNLPRDATIGSLMTSQADTSLIAYLQSLPTQDRWRRLPYGDLELMLERLEDGTLGAALVWEPALYGRVGNDLEAAGLRAIDPSPLFGLEVSVAFALLGQNVYLRQALDAAIGSILEDGTLAAVLQGSTIPAALPPGD